MKYPKWHRELKEFFHKLQGDIPYCEACGRTKPPLDMAHSKKRRFITTREDYFTAAMLCRNCHNTIELQGDHEVMRLFIENIIANRSQ